VGQGVKDQSTTYEGATVEEHSCGGQDLNGATAPEEEKSIIVQWCKNVLYTQKYKIIILWINNYFENFILGHHLRFPVILDMDTYGNSHYWIVLMKLITPLSLLKLKHDSVH